MTAEIAVRHPQPAGELPGNELAHLATQRLAFEWQLDRVEMESGAYRRLTIRCRRPTLQPVHSFATVGPLEV
jgi:hypothetical protein